MNRARLLGSTSILRLFAVAAVLPVAAATVYSAPCAGLKAAPDAWIKGRVNALVIAARALYERDSAEAAYRRVVDTTKRVLDKCGLDQSPEFSARYPAFRNFVNTLALAQNPDHELGFTVTDQVYFAETRQYVEVPAFLLTPAFLRAVSRFETLPEAKTMLRRINATRTPQDQLIFFSYESRHLGTPDNPDSFQRLLIVVPGNTAQQIPEKWIQFGITNPGQRVLIRNLSVVAVVPGPNATTNVYFKDYFRTFRRGTITIKGRWELGEGDDNCVMCHKSGVLPIFPVAGSVSRAELPLVAAVNQRFRGYGQPRFGKYFDAAKLGPGLGSNTLPEVSGSRATCAECHQPNGLGALNWPMDRVLISSFVKGGQMPFGIELLPAERERLYKKIIDDYFAIDDRKPGILKTWLLGKTFNP